MPRVNYKVGHYYKRTFYTTYLDFGDNPVLVFKIRKVNISGSGLEIEVIHSTSNYYMRLKYAFIYAQEYRDAELEEWEAVLEAAKN